MNDPAQIVIGYDGSEHADAALDDLRRAGLPRDAEALIISLAEGVKPPLSVSAIADGALDSRRVASAVTYASSAISQAKEFARLGGERIKSNFPEWEVNTEYLVGDPADALMERATNWGTNLIVVGSQGRSAIGRPSPNGRRPPPQWRQRRFFTRPNKAATSSQRLPVTVFQFV